MQGAIYVKLASDFAALGVAGLVALAGFTMFHVPGRARLVAAINTRADGFLADRCVIGDRGVVAVDWQHSLLMLGRATGPSVRRFIFPIADLETWRVTPRAVEVWIKRAGTTTGTVFYVPFRRSPDGAKAASEMSRLLETVRAQSKA